MSKVSAEDIRSLLGNLLSDINKLYNAHIAYTPDITTLLVAEKRNERTLWPFIDTFDFSKHVDDQAVPWEDLKKKTVELVKSQFYVLEQLARLRDSWQTLPSFVKFQPDSVVEILQWTHAPQQHLFFRQVNRYLLKFGKYIYIVVESLICSLHPRTGPADEFVNNRVRDGFFTISHTLGLLDQYLEDRQIEHSDLADQAKL
ncbi:hypothetical protein F4782DRAFT_513466 [Xylaria castorea]|nr:hypothetical protein F4782DRAFT_513466 [Xylaria castorea]